MENKSINEQNAKNASVKKMSPGEKAALHPTSAKRAIAAHCYHGCQGQDEINSHLTKRSIANCPEKNCGLWLHRGWQELQNHKP